MSSVTSADNDEETFLSIGLDHGTTNSGLAWALSTDPNEVAIVSQWDSKFSRNFNEDKVPSRISYSDNGVVTSWGYDMKPNDHHLSWFKLLMADATKATVEKHSCHPGLIATLTILEKEPVDIASDYLQKLWEHATRVIKSKIGEALFDSLQIKVVLTVPAIWDHQGQDMTRRAADRAGITKRENTTLKLVSEPEAAALAVLKDNRSLKTGDTFVVCDAGGGTVDLVSYRIEKTKPRKLTMCTEATGGLHGATFLDDAFVQLITSLIGHEEYKKLSPRSISKMMQDWEHGIKRSFKHDEPEDEEWIVDLPGYPGPKVSKSKKLKKTESDLEVGLVKLNPEQIKSVFQKVCPHILDLVRGQIIELQKFASLKPKGCANSLRVLWSVIARGAAFWGLDDSVVVNHIARYSYGVRKNSTFIEHIHSQQDRFWCEYTGTWKARNQMEWYSKRGANIGKTDPIRHDFSRNLDDVSELANYKVTIWYSEVFNPPERKTSDMKRLCKLKPYFSPTIWSRLPEHKTPQGRVYRKISYTIEMVATGGSLLWRLDYNGVEKARQNIDAEYHHQ